MEEIRPSDLSFQMNRKNPDQNPSRRLALRWAAHETFHVPVRTAVRCERRNPLNPICQAWNRRKRFILSQSLPFILVALLAGCSTPAVRQQRLVAKPNMLFADSAVFSYNSPKLLPQLAPGFAGAGGAQNSGCTSCR